jgi:hypothetical protein
LQISRCPKSSDSAGSRVGCSSKRICKLTEEDSAKLELQIKKTLKNMKLKESHNNIATRRTGGIPLKDNTLQRYEKNYDSLFFFFSRIQVYESLLMLRKEPLEYVPYRLLLA